MFLTFFVMSLNTCFIFDEWFNEGDGVIVKRKGIITFINSRNIRKDDKADIIKNLESVMKNVENVTLELIV